jgi:uncharacterized protein (DUF849 family)
MQFLPRIRQATDAVVNITTGGAPGMTMDERLAAPERASPEMTSLNMGSINVGLFAGAGRITEWRYAWEKPFLEGSRDGVFRNTFADIGQILERMGKGHGCRFEFECYDVAHLYNLAWFLDQKLYEPPLFLQFCLGILGGIGADVDHLLHLLRTAQRLFGADIEWSVLAAGRHQMPIATHNALRPGRQPLPRTRPTRPIQRRPSRQDRPHPGRTRPDPRNAHGSAPAAGAEGRRSGGVLEGGAFGGGWRLGLRES